MYKIEDKGQWQKIEHQEGPVLGIASDSTVQLIEEDGLMFKDLNKNGQLDPYEDWRLPIEERVADLAERLSIEEIAGLMLYSSHQAVSSGNDSFSKIFGGTYNGQNFAEYDGEISDLTDQQIDFLVNQQVRHFLLTAVDSAEVSGKWANNLQARSEGLGLGIPVNISSDPRHGTSADTEFNSGAGGDISKWPEQLGLAATFNPKTVKTFGEIARQEYRALGIATALSPQIDLATEPRWMRFDGTFGEGTALVTELAKAYCDGFQTTPERKGWGSGSVNAMVKHWPGGGSGESGRDAHFAYGKYAVYPGKNFDEHLKPFIHGAFALEDGTKKASAVMPYYTISYDIDQKNHENVGNGFNRYLVTDLLRETYDYDGVVCTDWNITKDAPRMDDFLSGKPWGVEALSEEARHYKALLAGVDQFGGNNQLQPVLAAYQMGVEEFGEAAFTERFKASAKRLLTNIMQVGLFENPYVDIEATKDTVGKPAFMAAGFKAQLESIVLLKNKQVLPLAKKTKVYVPKNSRTQSKNWFGQVIPAQEIDPINTEILNKYYERVDTPDEAEVIICFADSPITASYDTEKGFLPISLQYGDYVAATSRVKAIVEEERTYHGKTNSAINKQEGLQVKELKERYPDKRVVVVLKMENPTIMTEIEPYADAILVEFGVQSQAILEILSGNEEPKGKLPFQMPANMETVEAQQEDVPLDMTPYVDEVGHVYDYGFGLTD
ncbi:beta-glucosidase [Enterococcus sp. AZ194]|uniref:glycoside hydrolase family 3 protein n=1 Tax=Enterococcus sp. AZ194 TaxID=2774629 RepID=UPI003F1E5170